MMILILILFINLSYTKDLPNKPSVVSVLLRSRRSNSGESIPSLVRYGSSNSKINYQLNQRQEKEEEQIQDLLDHQEKAARKEEKALRRLIEKLVKQEQKDEEKHEKKEQKRHERIENEKRKEEDRKRKILLKREKEEQKKQTERKHTEKLQNETLNEESTIVNIEEENPIDLDDIWRNLIYTNYGLTLLSTRPEKQAAINKYMQEELGLISNSTSTDRRQAIIKYLEMKLENNTVLLDALKNQFISHINQVRLQKLRAYLDTNIDIINKKSEIINYVKFPWANVVRENLKEQRSIFQFILRFLSNVIPNWGTKGHNKSGNSSDDSNIDSTNGNEIERSTIMYSNISRPLLLSLDNNTAIGNNAGSSPKNGSGVNSSSDVSSGNNASLSLNDENGDTEDVISDKGNVLPTTPFLSIESTGFTETIIAVSVASANNDTNTEMIIKANDTASNALVPSANASNTEFTNVVENSSSDYTVSTISNEISVLVTASDTTDARSMSEKDLTTTAITIDATQKGEADNAAVTTESNTEVSESYVTITVNAEDDNVTHSIDTNKTISSTLGILATVSPVLETVSNLSIKANISLSTEATDVDTTPAQNIIDQVTVTGFNITNQLVSVTAANKSVVTTTATDNLINVNTASNNNTTEPSFNGRIKQPGQNPQLIKSDNSDDQIVHVQNTNGLTIPVERYKPNLQTRTTPSFSRFPNFYLLPSFRPILPKVIG